MKDYKADKMLRIGEVADRLDVSNRTVFRWLEQGSLKAHRFGRNLRISSSDLESFLDSAKPKTR